MNATQAILLKLQRCAELHQLEDPIPALLQNMEARILDPQRKEENLPEVSIEHILTYLYLNNS